MNDEQLVAALREVAVASISDALTQLGVGGTMSYEIKPVHGRPLVGPAVTVQEEPAEGAGPPTHALEAIDAAPAGSVICIGVGEARDVAVWGGLMTAGAHTRQLAGAVLDGGVRDVEEIERDFGFPVFARSISPRTTVGSYRTVAANVPVRCGGVEVQPGDLLCGDRDGVAVVPRSHAEAVLERAREIETREAEMTEMIKRYGTIGRAVEEYERI
jgi:4-hydroxy-4-methyl-2-oxoglutarate aldolase